MLVWIRFTGTLRVMTGKSKHFQNLDDRLWCGESFYGYFYFGY